MLEVEEHRRTVEKTGSLTVVTTKADIFSLSGRHTSLGIRIGNLLVANLKNVLHTCLHFSSCPPSYLRYR
jgi:hypothetical protein